MKTKTIDAMKNLIEVAKGEPHATPRLVNATRSAQSHVDEAVAREEAQTVERANAARYEKLRRWMSSNVKEGWEEVERMGALASWESWDAMDGYLDALPVCNVGLCESQSTRHTAKQLLSAEREAIEILTKSKPCPRCPTESGEREALIARLHDANKFGRTGPNFGIWKEAADMLAADAQEIDELKKKVAYEQALGDTHFAARSRLEAQQVAVPQGWKLVPISPDLNMAEAGKDAELFAPSCRSSALVYRAMLAAAPQPPQAGMNPLWLATHPDKLEPPQAERVPMRECWQEWMPISTAPKDGSMFRAYADELIDMDFNPQGSVECAWDGESFIGCVWNGQQDAWYGKPINPAQWMPIPDAPSDIHPLLHDHESDNDAMQAAWLTLRPALGTAGWTVSDNFNFRGFFGWGWEARGQYDAPIPPQADALAPMTDEQITNVIPAHFVPSGVKTFWNFARAIEAHHGIGVKP